MSSKADDHKLDFQQDQKNPLMNDDNEFRLLPELLKIILTKAALVQMYSKDTAKRQRDNSIFNNLASVDFRWWSSMKKYNLRNKILHHSKVYFQRPKTRSTIIRNNRNFLINVIDPNKIILPLKSCGCLTEDQVTFFNRLRNRKDKNHELLFMLQDFSSQKYSKFIDCLFATTQTPAALVLERGGEAVKVRINNEKATRTREFEVELMERFKRRQTENTLILNDMLNAAAGEKRLNDFFILHAKQNKGIELWFWCKTETSLNQLKGLSAESLREIIKGMYERLIPEHSISLKLQLIQMDSTFASEFAERRFSIRHVGLTMTGFELSRKFHPNWVTSLADKIYVAQESQILVYKNKYPYKSLKPIIFNHRPPGFVISIASCRINKCLYVSLSESHYVFKVETEFDNRVSPWLNETDLSFVSVTSKGEVLVLNIRHGNRLRICTHEGMVKRSIPVMNHISGRRFIHEIMPDIGALSYTSSFIVIMRLNENGSILYNIDYGGAIICLSPLRYGDLLIGMSISRYKNATMHGISSDLLSRRDQGLQHVLGDSLLQNNDTGWVQIHRWPLRSKANQEIVTTHVPIDSFYFAADQKQLYVLSHSKLYIYQLIYEDEDYNR